MYKENLFKWKPKKQDFAIGRIMHMPPKKKKKIYLWLLLNIQRDCTCYEDIRIVDHVVYLTFKNAFYALGLLDDDKEYIDGIKEASRWASTAYLRRLFGILLISNCLNKLEYVWKSC